MDRDYLIKLTLAVYQASEDWGKDNFLKFKVRNLANEILAGFILFPKRNPGDNLRSKILREIEILQDTLKEARARKLIDRNNFLLFQKEYSRMGGELEALVFPETLKKAKKEKKLTHKPILEELNERQKKIMIVLEKKQKVQVWELKEFFPGVSKRTLRRDLDGLLKKQLVERSGEWNEVFYSLPKTISQKELGQKTAARTEIGQEF